MNYFFPEIVYERFLSRSLKQMPKTILMSLAIASLLFGCNSPSDSSVITPAQPAESPKLSEDSSETPDLSETSDLSETPDFSEPSDLSEPSEASELSDASDSQPMSDDDLETRLAMAGIEGPQEAKEFLEAMRIAAEKEDRVAIAALIHYPFKTYETGVVQAEYESPTAFLVDFDQIVTDDVLSAMQMASYEDLFVNYQGAMIGNGAVWFMKYDEGVRVKAINSF